MSLAFDAYVTAALFETDGEAVFALGDGQVCWEAGARQTAHDGAVLAAVRHPTGEGVISGGDDGRLVWSRRDGTGQRRFGWAQFWAQCRNAHPR